MHSMENLFKGKKRDMSDVEMRAKAHVLQQIRNKASKSMGDKLSGMKKITVASDDPEGLKAGLEKAEEVVDQMPDEMSPMVEECKTPEEVDQKIAELEALKAKMLEEGY